MAHMPKRVKYRKQMRRGRDRNATSGNYVAFGEFGLQALEGHWMSAKQIEAGRIAATHFLRRQGKIFIRVFPSKPVSKKPLETRMGKGKGDLDHWICQVKRGKVLFEIGGIPEDFAKQIFRLVAFKLPVRTKFVTRGGH